MCTHTNRYRTQKSMKVIVTTVCCFCRINCFSQINVAKSEISPDTTNNFVFVEGGLFLMGDVSGDGPKLIPETPVHTVELGSFFIGTYEVPVVDFSQFVDNTGYLTSAEKHEGVYSQSPYETHKCFFNINN